MGKAFSRRKIGLPSQDIAIEDTAADPSSNIEAELTSNVSPRFLFSSDTSDSAQQLVINPCFAESNSLRIAAESSTLDIDIPITPATSPQESNVRSQASPTLRADETQTNAPTSNNLSPTASKTLLVGASSVPQHSSIDHNRTIANEEPASPASTAKSKWKSLRTAFHLGTTVTSMDPVRLAPLADNEGHGQKKISLNSLTTFRSQLTNDVIPQMRIKDWERLTDRNLCHVYRLCEDYQRFGYGQCELGQHVNGVDFLQSIRQTDVDPGQAVSLLASKKNERAENVLEQCGFFHDFNASVPGFISSIAAQAVFTAEAAGQIIFRQNDLVGNVYVIVSGQVSLYTHSENQLKQMAKDHYSSPRPKDCPRATTLTEARWNLQTKKFRRRGSAASIGSCSTLQRSETRETVAGGNGPPINETTRFLTVEGFSTFCEKSNIGNYIGQKESGTIFGEKGAMAEEKKRNATVKCLTDCELLTILGQDYKAAFKHVKEKMKYFDEFVPGTTASKGGAHGSTFFKEANFPKGHSFLTEGVVSRPAIYVIKGGVVEFRRCEDPLVDPAREFRCSPHGSAKSLAADQYAMQTYERLSDHGIFCTLSAFPIHACEPFSAFAAASDCAVYLCTNLHKLPVSMLDSIRAYAMRGLEQRLLPLKVKLPDAFTLPCDKFKRRMETAFDWSMQENGDSTKIDSPHDSQQPSPKKDSPHMSSQRSPKKDMHHSSQQRSPKVDTPHSSQQLSPKKGSPFLSPQQSPKKDSRHSSQHRSPKRDSLQNSQQRFKLNDSPSDKRRKRPLLLD